MRSASDYLHKLTERGILITPDFRHRGDGRKEMPQNAYRFEANVGPQGKLEFSVPIPEGTAVEVLVLTPESDDFSDLVSASTTSLGFWDNPMDDEDWNNA